MNRREFITSSGALIVAFAWRRGYAQSAANAGEQASGSQLPGSLKTQPLLDGWIRIDADGRVTVFTGKAELGQGIKTALIQVAAEELVLAPDRIALVTADTERTANEGYTAGSHSMQDSGTAIRNAAAQVREILLGIAAQRLSVPRAQLTLDNGVIHGSGRNVSYGELVTGDVLHVNAAPHSILREPASHFVVGKSVQRVDIPAKVTGGAAYLQDMRLDGMVHGRVIRPPSAQAVLKSIDTSGVERLPGVLKVVRDGRFIAVVAQREFQAIAAMRVLAQNVQWDEHATLPAPDQIYDFVRTAPSQDYVILDRGNTTVDTSAPGVKTVTASYRRPYQMHGSIGPSCAIAQFVDGKYTIWSHTQGVYPLRKAVSEMLSLSEEQVHCVHVEGSGCYGHNGADDVAADAALLARALPGRPVRVQWMREDEHGSEPYGPAMLSSAKATLDAAGDIATWRYEVWSNSHSSRPGGAGDLLAATHLAQPFTPTPPKPIPQPEGGGDRNAIPFYTLTNAHVIHHFLPQAPLRVSALRSLGAYMNVFSVESFMDELARAANADPVAYRMRHMQDARALEVMRVAADQFGWTAFKRRPAYGRGFAFARYKNLAAYLAIACEVEVLRDTGELRVLRVVAAVDSGEAVN
ncbi:MAG TPA: molybdopterin cofactor-binding domain-containing protein, partial [Rhodocyclaceae bacterium]|nr:molybdopterin cofactor-binding domain-containing protein [Rhodocyclaceae bacterium]